MYACTCMYVWANVASVCYMRVCIFICVFYTRGSLCMRLCIRVKKKENRRKSRRYASDSRVAGVILSVYYAKRWAENNSFSRVLRSIRSDPIHRSSCFARKAYTLFAFEPRENARNWQPESGMDLRKKQSFRSRLLKEDLSETSRNNYICFQFHDV